MYLHTGCAKLSFIGDVAWHLYVGAYAINIQKYPNQSLASIHVPSISANPAFKPNQQPSMPVAKPVRDRIAAIAAEIFAADLHAGRGLPTLVFGDVKQVFHALDCCFVMALCNDFANAHLMLNETFKNIIDETLPDA